MSNIDAALFAGQVLKRLIKENYATQEDFAYDYGIEIRAVSRYVNEKGITKTNTLQELAEFFGIPMSEFCPPLPENGNNRKNTPASIRK